MGFASNTLEVVYRVADVGDKPDGLQSDGAEELRRRVGAGERHEVAQAGNTQHQAGDGNGRAAALRAQNRDASIVDCQSTVFAAQEIAGKY